MLKYGESTASDLSLNKLILGSLFSSIKAFWKSEGLKICFLTLYCLGVLHGYHVFEGILHHHYLPLRLFFPVFYKIWHFMTFKNY